MLRLKTLSLGPPKPKNPRGETHTVGYIWSVWVEETDTWLGAGDLNILSKKLEDNLRSNGKSVPVMLDQDLQRRICEQLPGWHGCTDEIGERHIGPNDLKRWLITMTGLAESSGFVDQEEANRRADICRICIYRAKAVGCFGCAGIASKLFSLTAGKSVPDEHQLESCSVCGCYNASSVWFPLDVLQRASGGLNYPESVTGSLSEPKVRCWRALSPSPTEELPDNAVAG